ncbi:MAG: hypothetical protein RMJ55_14390 [Roseiflexaceae bacterium]|nr:hypothetical protein [Roseiflexus sp.]MDW8214743.1 hypothetical protein [Roseiflexaceae bacterium]
MNQERVLRDLMALPPEAQWLAADFIALLRLRYTQESSEERTVLTDSEDTDFIGMWSDRDALTDSENTDFVGMWSDRGDMADSSLSRLVTRLREWG